MDPTQNDPSSQPVSSTESGLEEISTSSKPSGSLISVPIDVEQAVDACRREREENTARLKGINPQDPFISKFTELESHLDALKAPFVELQEAFLSDPSKAAHKEVALEEMVKKMLSEYEDIGLKKEDLGFLFLPSSSLTDFECNAQIVLCRLFNQKSYQTQVRDFIHSNRPLLLDQFRESGIMVPQEIRETDKLHIDITPALKGYATTHNKGKAPLIITLQSEQETFSFVFKPRDAQIDKAAFDCLQAVDEQIKRNLPQCVILNPKAQEGWVKLEELGSCSFWELKDGNQINQADFIDVWTFIEKRKEVGAKIESAFNFFKQAKPQKTLQILEQYEGQFHKQTFDSHKPLFESIKQRLQNIIAIVELEGNKRGASKSLAEGLFPDLKALLEDFKKEPDSLTNQAVVLDSVLTQMKVGDLIPQNFIFSRIGGELLLIPIDLEVVPASKTSIGVPLELHLKVKEAEDSVANFHSTVGNYPIRILPLATASMISPAIHSAYNSREQLSKNIMRSLENKYKLSISLGDLQKHVLVDLLNKDVPYCTQFQGELFYGPPSKGIKIGGLK